MQKTRKATCLMNPCLVTPQVQMFLQHEVIVQSKLGDSSNSASELRAELASLLDADKQKSLIAAAASWLEQEPSILSNAQAAEALALVKATTTLDMSAYNDYILAWLEHLESCAELHMEHCELGIVLAQLAARPLLHWETTLLAAQLERALAAKPDIPAIQRLLLDFEKADAVPHGRQRCQASVDAAKALLQKHQEDQGHQKWIVTSFESFARCVASQSQQRVVLFHAFVIQSKLSCEFYMLAISY